MHVHASHKEPGCPHSAPRARRRRETLKRPGTAWPEFVHKCSDVTMRSPLVGTLSSAQSSAHGAPGLHLLNRPIVWNRARIDFNRMEAAPSPGLVAVAPNTAERDVARSDEGKPPEPCRRRIVPALTLLHIERDAGHGRMSSRPVRRAMSVTVHIRKLQSLYCVLTSLVSDVRRS